MKEKALTLIAGLLVLVSCVACGHDNEVAEANAVVSDVVTTTTHETTTTKVTTTSTTTTTTIPTTAETVVTSTTLSVVTEELTEASTEPNTEECVEAVAPVECYLPITEQERILLCNLVAREYGSNYHGQDGPPVTLYERAMVVAVVMNRVNSPSFPNNIYDVLTQPSQFTGYIASDYYSTAVTDNVIQSVDYYFNHSSEFSTSILYFEGDGRYNYFS